MRLFTAIGLSAPVLDEVARVQAAVRDRLEARRWQSLAQAHLTVDFIGQTPEPLLPALEAMLKETTAASAPFELVLGGLGAFKNLKHPHVLWVGVEGDRPALLDLEGRMREGLKAIGLEVEARAYKPHITLARELTPGTAAAEAAEAIVVAPLRWSVSEVLLFKSDLKPTGAVHTVLSRYPLGG